MLQGGLFGYGVLYAFMLAIRHALSAGERLAAEKTETARLNEQLATAQLEALRRQMEPHFLFNSLNAIVGLMRDRKNDDAISSTVQLSDFLRRALRSLFSCCNCWSKTRSSMESVSAHAGA